MSCSFFFNDTATTEIYALSLHDALPICSGGCSSCRRPGRPTGSTPTATASRTPTTPSTRSSRPRGTCRSEEHTSELQSRQYLVCRLLLEKKKTYPIPYRHCTQMKTTHHT